MDRLLDILLSGIALLVFSPLMIPISIILKLTGEGDILFFTGAHWKRWT